MLKANRDYKIKQETPNKPKHDSSNCGTILWVNTLVTFLSVSKTLNMAQVWPAQYQINE